MIFLLFYITKNLHNFVGSNDVIEQPKKRGRRGIPSNLTPKISRKTTQKVTKARKSAEIVAATETSTVTSNFF